MKASGERNGKGQTQSLVSAEQRDKESYQSFEPVAGQDEPGVRVAIVHRASQNCWESIFSIIHPGKAASRPLCAM